MVTQLFLLYITGFLYKNDGFIEVYYGCMTFSAGKIDCLFRKKKRRFIQRIMIDLIY